jgi:hypothetical protein
MSTMDSNDRLDRALAALKDATAYDAPPAAVDAAIAAAIDRATKPRRFPLRWPALGWLVAPAAVAAAIAFVVIAQRVTAGGDEAEPVGRPTSAARPGPATSAATQFLPVVPLAELEQAGSALIVPARVPRMSLAELGLPVNPARAADTIDAELLVRRDGTLLAVRFAY